MTEPRRTEREQLLDELKRHHETIQEYGSVADQQRRGNQTPWHMTSGQVFYEDENGKPQITLAPKFVNGRVEAVEHAQQRIPQILEDLKPLTSDEELKLRHLAQGIESFFDSDQKPGGGPDLENPPERDMLRTIDPSAPEVPTLVDDEQPTPAKPTGDAVHSTDFRSVRWYGERYKLTTTQAACVKILWWNWQQSTPAISEITILDIAGSAGDRLRNVFDKGKHPAWGTMKIPARKGAFQLAENKKS